MFVRRSGGQSRFSTQLQAEPARSPAITALQHWLPDHLDDDLTVPALARHTNMSQRQFARVFAAEIGTTPAVYTDLTVETVAKAVGLSLTETLYRVFRRRLGTTPASAAGAGNSARG